MARRQPPRNPRPGLVLEPLEDRVVLSGSSPSYIATVYADVLHRAPTIPEVTFWAQQIQGGRPVADLAKGLINSIENRTNEVGQDFQAYLHRGATAAETSYYVNAFAGGETSAQVRQSFLNSPEYKALHSGTTAYVDALYHDDLGRNPDPRGEAFYVNLLNQGTSTASVVQDIDYSSEREGRLVDMEYASILGRSATAQEHVARVLRMNAGQDTDETLLAGILSSPENIKNHDGSLS